MAVFNYFHRKFVTVLLRVPRFRVKKSDFSCYSLSNHKVATLVQWESFIMKKHSYKVFYANLFCNSCHSKKGWNRLSLGCSVFNRTQTTNATDEIPFQQMLKFRKSQADRSLLIELPHKADISYVSQLCQKFGVILEMFNYTGESENIFFLVEFANQSSVQDILNCCQCKNVSDAFPVFSRIIKFERKNSPEVKEPFMNSPDDTFQDSPIPAMQKAVSISQLIEDIYVSEKLPELHTRLRFLFCVLLQESVSGLFPYCEAIPFGSSVNGVGRYGCDLDVMLRLYPEQVFSGSELFFMSKTCIGDVRALQQRAVNSLGEFVRAFFPGVSSIHKIIHARMPILKMKHKLLNLECDVSINNMSAVFMTEILHFYGEIDSRIRPLIYSIKKWAKESGLTDEVPGAWITNFSLVLLVLFFLQNRPVPILPPINNAILIEACPTAPEGVQLRYIKNLSHWQEKGSSNKENLAELLNEFFLFLGTFPFYQNHISVLTGLATISNHKNAIWIQYPFEEGMNVAKNVSTSEMTNVSNVARISTKFLSNNMLHKVKRNRDLMILLGLQNLPRSSSHKVNVGALLDKTMNSKRKNRTIHNVARYGVDVF